MKKLLFIAVIILAGLTATAQSYTYDLVKERSKNTGNWSKFSISSNDITVTNNDNGNYSIKVVDTAYGNSTTYDVKYKRTNYDGGLVYTGKDRYNRNIEVYTNNKLSDVALGYGNKCVIDIFGEGMPESYKLFKYSYY